MPKTMGDVGDFMRQVSMGKPKPIVYMEKVGGYAGGPGQPGSSMFNFGRGYGHLEMAAWLYGMRLELVVPQTWQKALAISAKGPERKKRLKEKAQQLYPTVDGITLKTCDALLILDYAIKREGR